MAGFFLSLLILVKLNDASLFVIAVLFLLGLISAIVSFNSLYLPFALLLLFLYSSSDR